MALTEAMIVECANDDALFALLSTELQQLLPDGEGPASMSFCSRFAPSTSAFAPWRRCTD
jgi:hypothetical protein